MLKNIFLLLMLGIIIGCSTEQQTANSLQPGAAESQAITSSSKSAETSDERSLNLVFFLDPNGGPCIMQNNILLGMADELKGKVKVRYVQTTISSDRSLFSHYGIRALPTLVLADSSGKEIRRMPPGVKKADAIRALIQSIPRT